MSPIHIRLALPVALALFSCSGEAHGVPEGRARDHDAGTRTNAIAQGDSGAPAGQAGSGKAVAGEGGSAAADQAGSAAGSSDTAHMIPNPTCPDCTGPCMFGLCLGDSSGDPDMAAGSGGTGGASGGSGGSSAMPAACGNGRIEQGETCDPPSSCPTSCDDGNGCTVDDMTGAAETCDVMCSHTTATTCEADGCCAPGCSPVSDPDCRNLMCGNGRIDEGETCDPPETCPQSCDDGNVCTVDVLSGGSDTCNAACVNLAITACRSGDACCPAGCDDSVDSDCLP